MEFSRMKLMNTIEMNSIETNEPNETSERSRTSR